MNNVQLIWGVSNDSLSIIYHFVYSEGMIYSDCNLLVMNESYDCMYCIYAVFAHSLQVLMEPIETANHSTQLTNSRLHEGPQCKYIHVYVCLRVCACTCCNGWVWGSV